MRGIFGWWVVAVTWGVAGLVAQVIPIDQEPRHRVAMTRPELRVIEVNIPAGDTTLEHQHDHDLATVNVGNGTTRTRTGAGEWSAPRLRMLGEVTFNEYSGKPSAHTVQNTDTKAYRLAAVENLRPGSWTTHAPIAAAGTRVLSEGRAFRAYEVRLDSATGAITHRHEVPVIVVLTAGSADVDTRPLTAFGQWALVPASQPHVIERRGDAARLIEIEVR